MLLVAIETSGPVGSLALLERGACRGEVEFTEGLVHGREITLRLDELFATAGARASDLSALAVSVGPGSYTGCRVGVTAAKTLGIALGVPVIGVSSLEVMAASVERELARDPLDPIAARRDLPLATLLDGRRGFLYHALFGPAEPDLEADPSARRLLADAVAPAAEVARRLGAGARICGDGCAVLLDLPAGREPPRRWVPVPAERAVARARVLGAIASARLAGRAFDREAIHRLEPAYLRPSEPEIRFAETASPAEGGTAPTPTPGRGAAGEA